MIADRPMRILHVVRSLRVESGGTTEAVRCLCLGLAALGVENEVAVLDPPSAAGDSAKMPVEVHWLGDQVGGYGYSSSILPWLRSKTPGYQAVVVHGLWQYSGLAVWRALVGEKGGPSVEFQNQQPETKNQERETKSQSPHVPYFVFPHGMLDPWFKRAHPLKHLKKWLYWPWAEYRVLRDARAVIFTSEEERKLGRKSFWYYRCHERVLALGIPSPLLDSDKQKDIFFKKHPELRGKKLILFLGRLHPKKGLDELLRAFSRLREEGIGHALVLVIAGAASGTGVSQSYEDDLHELASDLCAPGSVVFTGMLQGDAKWGAMLASSAFILPSHQENFGIAVAEALGCGTPVLISDKVNIWREIVDDGAGLVETDTVAGTYALLRRWLELPDQNKETMETKARDCFEKRFEITQAAKGLLGVIICETEHLTSVPVP
jgi:glycosyltransferase involved in cell wall biosynthesis